MLVNSLKFDPLGVWAHLTQFCKPAPNGGDGGHVASHHHAERHQQHGVTHTQSLVLWNMRLPFFGAFSPKREFGARATLPSLQNEKVKKR